MLPQLTPPVTQEWYRASELASIHGLPGTSRRVKSKAKGENWKCRPNKGRGGGWEYHISSLPWETRQYLAQQFLEESAKTLPEERKNLMMEAFSTELSTEVSPSTPSVMDLEDWQKDKMFARRAIIRHMEEMAVMMGGTEKAVQAIISMAKEKHLPENLQTLVPAANGSKSTGKHTLSRGTLYRWRKALKKDGMAAVAPLARPDKVQPWAVELLKRYRQPSRPTLTNVIKEMARDGFEPLPTYAQATYYLKVKTGAVEKLRGRLGPKALKEKLPFTRRDTSGLVPASIYNADGHTWCALVAHPNTGKPFSPEVTSVIDVATRRLIGFSVGVSESSEVVIDALMNAVHIGGVMAVLQMDAGSGNKNKMMQDDITGLEPRLGFKFWRAKPGNSQGGGVIERFHQTLVEAAKRMPSFIGKRETHPDLRRTIEKKLKAGKLPLPTMQDLVALIQETILEYNDSSHRHLPKIKDHVTGNKRHQTPNEAWQQHADEGWEPVTLDDEDLVHEFRPEKKCTVRRGEITLSGLVYASNDLLEFNDKPVRIKYDIRDGSRVWACTMEGKFIGEAGRNANHKPYLDNVLDVGIEKRTQAKIKRLDAKKDKALAESKKTLELEAVVVTEEAMIASDAALKRMEPKPEPAPTQLENGLVRPVFKGQRADEYWGRWAWENFDALPSCEREDFLQRIRGKTFRLLIDMEDEEIRRLRDRAEALPAQSAEPQRATG